LNAFQINWDSDWHGAVSRSINVRRKDLDFMPSRRQRVAETMSRKDWPSIAHSGQVAWDNVEHTHKSTSQRPAARKREISADCTQALPRSPIFALVSIAF
jgi:hypothetical protein